MSVLGTDIHAIGGFEMRELPKILRAQQNKCLPHIFLLAFSSTAENMQLSENRS